MRKGFIIIAIIASVMLFGGCKQKETVEINYGESYTIENEKLSKYDSIQWTSEDDTIAIAENNVITGKGPGTVILTGVCNDKIVAEYTFNVSVVPVTSIVLSTNNTTITVDDGFQLNYSLFPDNASDYGIKWKSADESVAIVNDDGYVLAKKVGQTTISASNTNGVMATCSVTVEEKAAYERLSDEEKELVDLLLKNIDTFKNPESVTVKAAQRVQKNSWRVKISAMNGFGGVNSENYYLDDNLGIWNWDSLDLDIDVEMTPDSSFDIDLINEAINDKK